MVGQLPANLALLVRFLHDLRLSDQTLATEIHSASVSTNETERLLRGSYPVVFVVFKHANTMFNDEEEVDACQCRQALPHSVKG